ncbi:type I pullulanase [Pseudoneobacillus sp. C159]
MKKSKMRAFSIILIFALVMQLFSGITPIANAEDTVRSPIINQDSVTFNYVSKGESKVFVVGSFNGWSPDEATEMILNNGVFTATLTHLAEGEHQYKFLLNNRNWNENITDPLNPYPQVGGNSTFHIGEPNPIAESPIIDKATNTVTFQYGGKADRVRVAGTFTSWADQAVEMVKNDKGIWQLSLPLAPGRYQYKFIVGDNGWITDPGNPKQEDGNSALYVPGIIVIAPNDVEKGNSITLTANLMNIDGEQTAISPVWSLKDAREGITLHNNQLTIAPSYQVQTDDTVTVIATHDGKSAEKSINILNSLFTYTINYYRLDGKQANWDMWIWEKDKEGAAYPFTETTEDGYAKATLQFASNEINLITRPGNWSTQEMNRKITITEGNSIEVWIVQDVQEVYKSKPDISPSIQAALMDSKTDINVRVNQELSDGVIFKLIDVQTHQEMATTTTKLASNKVKLSIQDPTQIDVRKLYEVQATGFASKIVTMRNVLNDDSFYYDGTDLGYTYSPAQTTFKLWAPTATEVSLSIYENEGTYEGPFVRDNSGGMEAPMTRSDNGIWSLSVQDNLKNKFYLYKVSFADGTTNYAVDPYARSTSPNGQRSAIIDLNSTDPVNFNPTAKPTLVSPTDAILYELHVRDFSIAENSGLVNKGKYKAFTEKNTTGPNGVKTGVDSLKELGITHVHLLPVYDFGSVNELTVDDPHSTDPKFNWGYDPIHFNVPEGSYSTDPHNPNARVTEFKEMVQAMHDAGIRVVMDVVYNHTYIPESTQLSGGSPFDKIIPGYFYRTDDAGRITNGSGTGNEVASERPMVRKYIKDSVKYWATEYGVDGFRFDLMGLIDRQTMQELTKELKEQVDPTILIYGEPWTGGSTSLDPAFQNFKGTQKDQGYAVFNDNLRGAIKGGSDDASTGFATGSSGKENDILTGVKGAITDFTNRPSESINYVTAHDNLNLWDKIMKVAGVDITTNPHAIITEENPLDNEHVKRSLLANGIVLTSQGIPFIHAGEEFLRSKYGNHNSYKSPDSINQIRWELKDQYKPVFDYYQGLIELRKAHPAFKMNTKQAIEQNLQVVKANDNIVAFELKNFANNDTWKNITVIYNGNNAAKEVTLSASKDWKVVVDDKTAGTETIRTITGNKVTVAPLSMMVLYDEAEAAYTPVVTTIETNIEQFAINPGSTKLIMATVKDQKGRIMAGQAIEWLSSDDSVATVSNGKVTAIANGSATITAKVGSIKKTIDVTVDQLVPTTIEVKGDKTVYETYSTQLTALVKDQFDQEMLGTKVTWTSSDQTKAMVDGTGKVTGIKPGTVTITAEAGSAKASYVVTVKQNVQRYVRLKYVRPDKNFTDWNVWVWNTGVQNDQIDFTEFNGDTAIANIAIAPTTESIGFLIRKGTNWDTAKISPDSDDHNVKIDREEIVTKVTVVTGVPGQTVIPTVKGPVLADGNASFFYRDEVLYQVDQMHTLDSVKVKIDGQEYPMIYEPQNEYFTFTKTNLEPGTYEYSFLVTKDGQTTEVTDPKNTVDGKSTIIYTVPKVDITASIAPGKINHDENAVLTVEAKAQENVAFKELYVDLTSIGGSAKLLIDPALGKATISAKDTVSAGMKELVVTVIDEFGNKHTQTVTIEIAAKTYQGKLNFDWDEARIYFMLTDRFFDGDKTNNGVGYDPTHPEAYHGGDFRGIIEKLDYLDQLGINTIWISPIVDNIDFNKGVDFKTTEGLAAKQYGYHGYWAKDFTKLEEHFGDIETFKELIDKAHARGIKIMVDVVLNHAGYGMNQILPSWQNESNLPTDEERAVFDGMLRTEMEDPTVRGELDGLPDFKTEDPAVRAKIIEWQTAWLEKARTDKGETIDFFRVDTVKHVEETTWKAFKNALTTIDPDFKLIGEYWGAGINNDGGYLKTGQMDSLLDFDFKEKARDFVNGNIDSVEAYLQDRNARMDNTSMLGQFLSSHDQDGFLSEYVGGDVGKLMVAAALQITAKGQPVIYYGEELGNSGKSSWERDGDKVTKFGQNRSDMPWDKLANGDATTVALHDHYTKLLNIREGFSKVFAKGTRTKIAGGNAEQFVVTKREYKGEAAYIGLNTAAEAKKVTFNVDYPNGKVLTDVYSGKTYTVTPDKRVTVDLASRAKGGTFILVEKVTTVPPVEPNPPEGPSQPTTPAPAKPEVKDNIIIVSGKAVTVKDGKATVNEAAVLEAIKDAKDIHKVVFQEETATEFVLPANVITALFAKNNKAVIEVENSLGSYTLSVKEVDLEALKSALGTTGQTAVEFFVSIRPSTQSIEKLVAEGFKPLSDRVDFQVGVRYNGKTEFVNRFTGYVERTILFNGKVNPSKAVVMKLTENGFVPVPTVFKDGVAIIRTKTNSIYVVVEGSKTFSDITSKSWAKNYIETLAAKGLIAGKTKELFSPGSVMTRGEYVSIIVKSLGLITERTEKLPFKDISGSAFEAEILAAYQAGIIQGKQDGSFAPDAPISRAQAAIIISRAMKYVGYDDAKLDKTKDVSHFKDANSLKGWGPKDIELIIQAGIMSGTPEQTFNPNAATKRDQAAKIIVEFLSFVEFM